MFQSNVRRTRAAALALFVLVASIGATPIAAPSVAAAHPDYEELEILSLDPLDSSRGEYINDAGRVTLYAGGGSGLWSWTEAGGLESVPQIGSLSMIARAMNESGQIAGTANSNTSDPNYAFRWTPGGGTEQLASLSAFGSSATDMNDFGVVVGGSFLDAFTGHAVMWLADGSIVDIGRPGRQTFALRVANSGHVLIRDGTVNEWYVRAPDGVEWPLGHLGGGVTNAFDMNNSGHVVGLSTVPGGDQHGFFWSESTGMIDIGSLGGQFSMGAYINDNDQVAGRATLPGENVEVSWFWSVGTGLVQIPTLGGDESNPNAINDNGVVVGYAYTATNEERAYVWNPVDGTLELDARGGDDINNAGQIIATRERPTGGTVAVLFREPAPDPDPDADGDGIEDAIEVAGQPKAFDDLNGTAGFIVDANGLPITVSDAPAPDGVHIVVGGTGPATAQLSVCAGFTLHLSAGSDVVVTCGSVSVTVVAGSAVVEAGGGAVLVTVPAGSSATVSEPGDGSVVVENLGAGAVTVDAAGSGQVLGAGESVVITTGDDDAPSVACDAAPTFVLHEPGANVTAAVFDAGSGPASATVTAPADTSAVGSFTVPVTGADLAGNTTTVDCAYSVVFRVAAVSGPVNPLPTVNVAKAGQAIPVKWRVSDYFGAGVADPTSFVGVRTTSGECSTTAPFDAVESYAGNSGLQYLGNGTWQFNWKTPKSYAGLCRDLHVDLADGGDLVAAFRFK